MRQSNETREGIKSMRFLFWTVRAPVGLDRTFLGGWHWRGLAGRRRLRGLLEGPAHR